MNKLHYQMNKILQLNKLFLLVGLTILSFGCKPASIETSDTKPNFLFILVDDLGKEWISAYGADSVQTPVIDELAATGITFHNVYSMPQCTPSRVTLLTGKYPYNHGWINHYDVPRWGHGARFDPEKNVTVANILNQNGYKTCAAGKWQINDFRLEPEAMVNAGFEDYCMWTGGEGGNEEISSHRYWDPYIHTKEGSSVYEGKFGPDIFCDFIIDFMKENKDDPMFIYYPMVLTHGPLVHTPAEPNASTKIEKHTAMTRYTDIIVKRLVDALDELEIRDNTYVIFTTDNGTAGSVIGYMDGRAVRGGKTFLTENGVNAPFVINRPGGLNMGSESGALIDFTDMFPTFLELAGIELPAEENIDGISFAPLLEGENNHSRDWVLAMGSLAGRIGDDGMIKNWYDFRDRALRNERFKVYVDTMRTINRLFDLETDPYEQENLIESEDDIHRETIQYFQEIIAGLPEKDNNPDYTRLDTSIYDVPPAFLVKSHGKDKKRKSNMSPPVIQN